MAVALLAFLGLLAVAGIVMWVLAIRISYCVEQQRDGDKLRPALAMTNMFRSAFWAPLDDKADPKLRRQLQIYIYAALGCMIVMAAASFALPLLAVQESAHVAKTPPAPVDPTGTTLTYIRSNQDGTLPEFVYVHPVSLTEIHVAKMVSPCTDAAYVTGIFDPATHEATQLIGGRLNRDGEQTPQVWLTFLPDTRKIEVRFGDPKSKPTEEHDAPSAPWRMYDFDLAEFALFGPRAPGSFNFGVAMAWPDGTAPTLRVPGDATAKFLYSSEKATRNHFRIGGPAFTDPLIGDRGGEMVLDAKLGHVIEARFGRPNHAGYANFQLKLVAATPAPEGEAVWRKALSDHWANCPVETKDK